MVFYLDEIKDDTIVFHMNQFLVEETVHKDENKGYSIAINLGQGRETGLLLDPYFKLYDSADPTTADHVVRISLLRGELSKEHEGLPPFTVNAKVKKILIKNIARKSTLKKFSHLTVYDALWACLEDYATKNNYKIAPKLLDVTEYIKLLEKNL